MADDDVTSAAAVTRRDGVITSLWDDTVVDLLHRYVEVPALSPAFDSDWERHGHLLTVVQSAAEYLRSLEVPGLVCEVLTPEGRPPLLWVEVAPTAGAAGNVLVYGHLDKQPEMTGWADGLGPWTPVERTVNGRRLLYGRGGADDGYAVYAAGAALVGLAQSGSSHPRIAMVFETEEESGSPNLPLYLDELRDRIGVPDYVVCLDSGAGDAERLWLTTSLRGMVHLDITVSVLTEGVHSGSAGGIVPESFLVLQQLLARLCDPVTGRVLVDAAWVDVPASVRQEAVAKVAAVGAARFPWAGSTGALQSDAAAAEVARTWEPALAVIGADGLPPTAKAGNVLRASTTLGLSLRLPPGADPDAVGAECQARLTADPPFGANVEVTMHPPAEGWAAPRSPGWLQQAIDAASERIFAKPSLATGEGGTIPFMAMLGRAFPDAGYLITGVLLPGSNAHGPNEFLDLDYARDLARVVADVLSTPVPVRED